MKRVLPLVLALALLTGCVGGGPAAQLDPTAPPAEPTAPTAEPTPPPAQPTPTAEPVPARPPRERAVPDGAAEGYADFSLEFLRTQRTEGKNVLLSPPVGDLGPGHDRHGRRGKHGGGV